MIALSAWFCVEELTLSRVASVERNAVTSASPSVAGCRFPWKIMKRLIQPMYAFSVRQLKWRVETPRGTGLLSALS